MQNKKYFGFDFELFGLFYLQKWAFFPDFPIFPGPPFPAGNFPVPDFPFPGFQSGNVHLYSIYWKNGFYPLWRKVVKREVQLLKSLIVRLAYQPLNFCLQKWKIEYLEFASNVICR